MSKIALSIALSLLGSLAFASSGRLPWKDIKLTTLQGKPFSSEELEGKVVLVVNTASKCGYTSQLKSLQDLQKTYEGKGLRVLGFPSHDFNQEPGSEKEIADFCQLNYGVTFPLFKKDSVKGPTAQPLYAKLFELAPPQSKTPVAWNFEKYLLNKKGEVLEKFPSSVTPNDPAFLKKLEAALAE